MAPIKFEENIKDRLEQRTLKPSPDAWSKLSNKLDAEPKKKTNKAYWWLGIAASFVGLLIVFSALFSNGSDANINAPIIVEEQTQNPIKENKDILEDIVEEEKAQEIQVVSEEKDNIEIEKPNKLVVKNKSEAVVLVQENPTRKKEVETIVFQEADVVANVTGKLSPEDKKVNEVVRQIKKLQEEKSSVTDAEIDALLNQAQEELMTQSLYDKSTKTVDAELLLLQVETDLDQSFRDRVFDALKSSYKKVKTAVAERNN